MKTRALLIVAVLFASVSVPIGCDKPAATPSTEVITNKTAPAGDAPKAKQRMLGPDPNAVTPGP